MRKHIFVCILMLVIITSAISAQKYNSENLFYYVDTYDSYESLKGNIGSISIVAPSSYRITENGSLYGAIDPRVIKLAKANNVKVIPLIVNAGEGSFDDELIHKIVENAAARRRSIEMMIELAAEYGFDGWQFDIEHLHIRDKEKFTGYYAETAQALHENGLLLSAAVVHQLSDFPGHNRYHMYLYEEWRAGYDLAEMSRIGDFLSIMTYDQHTRRTPPGPVSGYEWAERVIKYLIESGIEPSKISLGLPTYSVHWFPDYTTERGGFVNARHLSHRDAIALTKRFEAEPVWDTGAGCSYARWSNDGVYEYIYIEDNKSFAKKLDILKNYGLRGISVWRLGSEHSKIWKVLGDKTSPVKEK